LVDDRIYEQLKKDLDNTCQAMQQLIHQESVVTKTSSVQQCAAIIRDYFLEFGCATTLVPTDGNPVVLASYDANATKTLIVYLWYDTDVLMDGWSTPPLEGCIVPLAPFGTCMIGRGAFTKGSLVAFVEAMRSWRTIRKELPINLIFVIEGDENLGSRTLPQFVEQYRNQLSKGDGVLFPRVAQDVTGGVRLSLGSKGMIRFTVTASGKRWGRGPQTQDCHSAEKAWVDNPLWRLLHGLSTLTDGRTILIPGFHDAIQSPSLQDEALLLELEKTFNIVQYAQRIHVKPYLKPSRELLCTYLFSPTLNIERVTGAQNNFRIPAQAAAQLEIRYVPNQKAEDLLAKIREHLDTQGYPDLHIEVNGVIDYAKARLSDPLTHAVIDTYHRLHVQPEIWPNSVTSSPWNVFSSKLELSLVHGGLGHAGRHHGSDEYFVINPQAPYFGLITGQQSYIMIVNSFAESSVQFAN
jgi:acetylornithine deacetylase/succinyl-diaminopimelate desuccinylase-like protein